MIVVVVGDLEPEGVFSIVDDMIKFKDRGKLRKDILTSLKNSTVNTGNRNLRFQCLCSIWELKIIRGFPALSF